MNQEQKRHQLDDVTVSVVVATYNRAQFISDAIDSLLGQTRPPDEVIVVNDGSTDNTKEVITQYESKVRYLEKANGGKPSALNFAIPLVRSSYTWIFDDDDVALPHALETHLTFLEENPGYDFTYSPNYWFTGTFPRSWLERQEKGDFPPVEADSYFIWTLEAMRSMMQGMLVSTSCYRTVGLFDEELLRGQDYEMVLRLARRFRAGRIDTVTFAIRAHTGSRGPGFARHAENQRANVWLRYELDIFGRLRTELPLSEYLPRGSTEKKALTPQQQRRALLQRAYVMANHGLLVEALEDFKAWARGINTIDAPLAEAEQRLLSMMTYVDNLTHIAPIHFYWSIGSTARCQPSALRWLSRGLYWSYARYIKHKRPIIIARVFILTCSLVGGYTLSFAMRLKDRHDASRNRI